MIYRGCSVYSMSAMCTSFVVRCDGIICISVSPLCVQVIPLGEWCMTTGENMGIHMIMSITKSAHRHPHSFPERLYIDLPIAHTYTGIRIAQWKEQDNRGRMEALKWVMKSSSFRNGRLASTKTLPIWGIVPISPAPASPTKRKGGSIRLMIGARIIPPTGNCLNTISISGATPIVADSPTSMGSINSEDMILLFT